MIHGTRNAYQNHKCRCQPCTTANTVWIRDYLKRRQPVNNAPTGYRIPPSVKGQYGTGIGVTATDIAAVWRESAACAGSDPNLWDIDNPDGWTPGAAICAGCPVQQQCLTEHLGNLDAFGLYGGVPLWAGVPMRQKDTA